MFMFILLGAVILLYYILFERRSKVMNALISKLKNDLLCLPLVGHAYLLMGNDEGRMKSFQRLGRIAYESGGLTGIYLGHRFFVMATDPKLLEVIMKNCLEKDYIMHYIAYDLVGNGSIFAPVPIWRPRRKVIAPTFSVKNLNQFMAIFSNQSSVMVKQLKAMAGRGTFSVWKYLTTYTMDSVCETALGIKVNAQTHHDQPFLNAFEKYCQMAGLRICLPLLAQKIYKYLPIWTVYQKHITCMWEFVDKVIRNKREKMNENVKNIDKENNANEVEVRKTFLELYIESSGGASGFTNVELREETLVLLLAGTDTSAVGAAFTCLLLSKYPEVQDKVYAEIQEVFGDSDRKFTADDLLRLKYLEAVVKESLRLYPPVPITLRKTEQDIVLPNGLELPRHTSVMVNIWGVHHNPEYWGADVEDFRPERFLEQDLKHPAAFMPFSYGPRSCLGYKYAMMSMQTSVGSLVRHYRLSSDGDPKKPLRVKFDLMMKHVDNFELQLEAR